MSEVRDTVFIGKKPLMAYVTAVQIQLASQDTVKVMARGMSISRAVDVAQVLVRKDEGAYSVGGIELGSVKLESGDSRMRNVSTIQIEIRKGS